MKYQPIYRIPEVTIETWHWVIEHYTAGVDDICELKGIKRRAAYEQIATWVDRGYFYRKSGFLLPTQRTYWECGVPYRFHDIGLDFLRHAYDVIRVERWLRNREDMIIEGWTGERELRNERGLADAIELYCVADHIPDAIASIYSKATGVSALVDIQVERSGKARDRWYQILTKEARDYEHIWYFADCTRVYQPLKTCIENLPAADIPKFHLWKLDTITCEKKTQFTSDITHI